METLRVRTRQKAEVVDVTAQVAEVVRRAGVEEGICTVFVRHATAAIVINENADPGFRLDLVAALDKSSRKASGSTTRSTTTAPPT